MKTPVNVMHFHAPSSSPAAIESALNAHVSANMWAHTHVNEGINEVIITPLDGGGISTTILTGFTSAWRGTQSTSGFLPQVCALIKHTTSLRGRSYRGRTFLPYPVEGVVDSGVLDPTTEAAMTTAWRSFLSGMIGAGVEPHVASYKHSSSTLIIDSVAEPYTATQRRRQPGR